MFSCSVALRIENHQFITARVRNKCNAYKMTGHDPIGETHIGILILNIIYMQYISYCVITCNMIKSTQTIQENITPSDIGRQILGHESTGYVSAAHPDWAKCASFRRVLKGFHRESIIDSIISLQRWHQMTKIDQRLLQRCFLHWFPIVSCQVGAMPPPARLPKRC